VSGKVHVVLASDANYLPGLEVTRASILRSCPDPGRIAWHVFDDTALEGMTGVQGLRKWNGSLMPYLRLWLPQMLPKVDWVIYSDVDAVWNRDVCELWDGVVGEKGKTEPEVGQAESPAIYWVRDFRSMRQVVGRWIGQVADDEGWAFDWDRYACSGVCVLNLKKMRERKFTERVLELFAQYGVPDYPDQDVLNLMFNRDSVMLPPVWDAMGDCSNLPPDGEKCVYHITGIGRHFHDAVPPAYPPQYQLWWRIRNRDLGVGDGGRVPFRSRILAVTWPLHRLAGVLPLKVRERVVRQWYFARELNRVLR